jgi:hypothetical protein
MNATKFSSLPFAFFKRHYNGDYSLARSYWINTLLITMFAPLIGIMLLPWIVANFSARYGSAAFLLIITLSVLAYFWAVAGTWASANKHAGRGGSSGWATVAKVVIVLGILRTFGDVATLLPTLQEHMRVAAGAQFGPDTSLQVRADGRSILLSGGINDGSAEQLDRALEIAPAIKTVVLSSSGGWIREGQMLADVIRKRALNTYVEGYCSSACTIAFLAGKERAAAPTAKIGFHASRSVGTVSTAKSEETGQLRGIYEKAGLPEYFVNRAIDTPSDQMWYPTHDVLLSAGVVTRKSMGGETAALSTAVQSREEVANAFKKTKLYAILAERSPDDFARVVDAAWSKLRTGANDAEVMTSAREQLTSVLPRFLPLASDRTLIAYQTLMQEELEALRRTDVNACVEMAFPSGRPMNVIGNLPPELVQREAGLLADVLREYSTSRSVKADQKALEEVVRSAVAGMTREQLMVFSDGGTRQKSDPTLTCNVAITYFAGLNAIPISRRGYALRLLYGS